MKEYPPLCTTVEPYLLPLAEEDEDEDKILKFELDTVDGSSTIHSNNKMSFPEMSSDLPCSYRPKSSWSLSVKYNYNPEEPLGISVTSSTLS
ncbi:hypothetical protein TNIN_209501 [Trichonephila inaurata madagascariensis]|uniref:Uncharacterized protein n=1 Tax=Trichonephila inaurata madagascariensis TaxID=2747483 RepID=A0A8X6IGJ9_9ARAC|nr:hypothetical protein TNIN_209501 [Trichonephila inaurata madagascariensis]